MPHHSKCYIFDFFYFLLFAYLIYHVISSWSSFSYCDQPLHIWLLVTFGFYILKRIIIFLMNSIHNSACFRFLLSIYLVLIFPSFVYWTIHGTIWTVQQSQNAVCSTHVDLFWLIYLCISVSYVLILTIIIYAIYEIIHFYRLLRIRRRIEDILNNIDVLLVSNALQNVYENNNGLIRHEMGLTENEKALLPQILLDNEKFEEIQNEECSICIEKISQNENIIVLPGCKHIFHALCVLTWLERKPFCPNCKGNIRNQIVDQMKEENV